MGLERTEGVKSPIHDASLRGDGRISDGIDAVDGSAGRTGKEDTVEGLATAEAVARASASPSSGRRLDLEILDIAWPMLLTLASDPIAGLVDTAFIGRLGEEICMEGGGRHAKRNEPWQG